MALRKIIDNIDLASIESEITQTQWLSKLLHGQIIANRYKQPIVFLGILECLTFIPLRTYPCGGADPIYLLHFNNTHWVLANVQGKDGVNPIPPPHMPKRTTSKIGKGWMDYIHNGLSLYEGLNPSQNKGFFFFLSCFFIFLAFV